MDAWILRWWLEILDRAEGVGVVIQTKNDRAEQIQRSMQLIRRDLDHDFDQVKQSASQLTDWRYYVRNYPWTCVGLAAAIGYIVVPRKLQIQSPDTKTLEKLARKNKLVIESKSSEDDKPGAVKTAVTFLSGLALRAVTAQLVQKLASGMDQNNATQTGTEADWQEEVTASAS
jgi:hypothetical protein